MHRRSHRKSRTGCGECKRRHLKCDETRPNCINCTTSKLDCSYSTKIPDQGNVVSFDTSHKSSPSSSKSTSTPQPLLSHGPYVNILHLELYHHFAVDELSLIIADDITRAQRPHILKLAFSFPFLMHELLACASMHLGLTHPEFSRRQTFLDEASRLQAEALMSFNDSVKQITDENVIPAFLFSGLLGLHSLSDVFSMPGEDLDAFLDRLVHSMRLLRGVQAILSGKWEMIRNSEIGALLQPGEPSSHVDEVVIGFEKLAEALMTLEGIVEDQAQVCQTAVRQLLWVYTTHSGPEVADGDANQRMVTSWPITVSPEYTDLLASRNPGALIVLAHFAVLMHRCRNVWAVGNAGTTLLNALGVYLSSEWDSWLLWPRTMIYGTSSMRKLI